MAIRFTNLLIRGVFTMEELIGKVGRLRVYIGEDEYLNNDVPLYRALLEKARKLDIAGGTALKGVDGYGSNTRMLRKNRFLDLSQDVPIVVELIDKKDNLAKLEGFLREHMKKGLVTYEEIEVVGYGSKQAEKLSK